MAQARLSQIPHDKHHFLSESMRHQNPQPTRSNNGISSSIMKTRSKGTEKRLPYKRRDAQCFLFRHPLHKIQAFQASYITAWSSYNRCHHIAVPMFFLLWKHLRNTMSHRFQISNTSTPLSLKEHGIHINKQLSRGNYTIQTRI